MDELCRQLAADLDSAFPLLVETVQDDLYNGLRRLHPDAAEDLTQETLIRAYRALSGYDRARILDLKLAAWLWTIALNLGRNHVRDRARRPIPVEWEDRFPDSTPEPPDVAAWQRRLGALPPNQRRAVVLRHVVGMGYSEIAEATGRPEGTVKADVHRGLTRLRTMLEGES